MKPHHVSILAVCLATGCAHGTATEPAQKGAEDKVAAAAWETPAQAEARALAARSQGEEPIERVDIPEHKRRSELASADDRLPAPKDEPDMPKRASAYGTEPDNTRVNERDRSTPALTPMDQGSSSSDIAITQRIRKDVISNDRLSMNARNVKIITRNGHVTLRGAVNTRAESASIQQSAQDAAGLNNVTNELEVAD